jgi:signal transduction histidine kinase
VDLQTTFICLLKNALEDMSEGGEVRVTTRVDGTQAFVEIADQGPGLDASVRDHVLEPFVTTRKGRSRGLGLTIAKGIIQRHCGKLEITDRPEGGVICQVRLETRFAPKTVDRFHNEEALTGALT